jgi:hypothetical protein
MDVVMEKIITPIKVHIINTAARLFGNLSGETRIFIPISLNRLGTKQKSAMMII